MDKKNVKKKEIVDWSAPSQRIKDLLKEKKMTQDMLAQQLTNSEGNPVTLQYVKQVLNKPSLTTDMLKQIADVLGLEIWELFISKEEVKASDGEICAFVKYKGEIHNPKTLGELKILANKLLPDEPNNENN